MDHKGNIIRAPSEVMHQWSLEDVLDANVVMDMMRALLDKQAEEAQRK